MRERAINKTTVCYWSVPDDCYVAESSVLPRTAGIGDTKQEALESLDEMMAELIQDLDKGRIAGYGKRGRPAKNGVRIHAQVSKQVKEFINKEAKRLGVSQGEFINHLCLIYRIHTDADKEKIIKPPMKGILVYDQQCQVNLPILAEPTSEGVGIDNFYSNDDAQTNQQNRIKTNTKIIPFPRKAISL